MRPHALSASEVTFVADAGGDPLFVGSPLAEHQRREAFRRAWRHHAERAAGIVHPAFSPVTQVGESARLVWRASPAFEGTSPGALARRPRAVGQELEQVWLTTDGRVLITGLPMQIGEDDPRLTALRTSVPVEALAPEQLLDLGATSAPTRTRWR